MRVNILTQYYPPEIGAAQSRLSEMAERFVQFGHSVTVITAMPNYPTGRIYKGYSGIYSRERLRGVDVVRTFIYPTKMAHFGPRLANYFSFVFSSLMFGSFIVRQSDYLLVESPPLFLGFSGYLLGQLKHSKLIFNVSDLWPESAVRLGVLSPGGLANKLSVRLEEFYYNHSFLITGQSRSILSNINDRFPELHTYHLSNGVDTKIFRPNKGSVKVRSLLGEDDKCIVLYAGLHGLAQGLDQLLSAAETLRGEKGFRFVLVGDGPEKKMLVQKAKQRGLKNVMFLEPRPKHEIPELLASADLILIPLKTHIPGAVPSKIYEAMASGRPIILVASGESADIVQDREAGLVAEPNDVRGLVHALQTLKSDRSLCKALGENGRRAAEQHFDRANIVDRFIEYLEMNLAN